MSDIKRSAESELWLLRSETDENADRRLMVRVDKGEWRELGVRKPVIIRGNDIWGKIELEVEGGDEVAEWEVIVPERRRVKVWVKVVYVERDGWRVRKDYKKPDGGIEITAIPPLRVEK